MKTLVIIAGQKRTWDITKNELFRMFNSLGSVQYFFLSPDNDLFDWSGKTFTFGPDIFDVPLEKINYPHPNKIKAIVDQWSMLKRARLMALDVECDWIVRCRPDLKVLVAMEQLKDLVPDSLYFPNHNNWGGLNDRFWFGPKDMMLESFQYYESAKKHLVRSLNLERLLARHVVLEKKIPFNRTCAVLTPLRANGTIDPVVYREDRGDRKPHEILSSAW